MPRVSAPSIPPFATGAVLADRFQILGVLGEGGAGTVYDALRLPEHERIALKVLHGHLLADRQFRGRFEREAQILARLGGPHVCPVLDSGEMDDPRGDGRRVLYIALPKIDGPALDTVLRREGPLPIPRVLDIVLQICDALKMAHAQGVVHRDLKPANVLLRGGSHVIVVDFGLAKILVGDAGATVLTAHNMVCGTPEYMAPEQARGEEIDARSDIYAAGVMLYEMLSNQVPFGGATPLAVLTAHLTETPVPPRTRAPERQISPALEAVVLHAMAKEPDRRYATAAALAAAILQARAWPDDIDGVRPGAARVRVEADAQGEMPTLPQTPPPSARVPELPARAPERSEPPHVPSVRPMSTRPSTRDLPAPIPAPPAPLRGRAHALAWIVATLVSIAFGVWLALRSS